MICFLLQLPDDTRHVLKADGAPYVRGQRMARELKLVDVLFWTLHHALTSARRVQGEAKATVDTQKAGQSGTSRRNEWHLHRIEAVVRLLYKSITCCFVDNRRNEVYIAEHGFDSFMPKRPVCKTTYRINFQFFILTILTS